MAKKKADPSLPWDHRLSRTEVPGIGPLDARVLLLGEGPGEHEDRLREPFVGPSGQLMTDILEQNKLFRDQLYITNVVKRRVAGNETPNEREIEGFRPIVATELRTVNPDYVIAAGGIAARFLLGPEVNLELHHGLPMWSERYGLPVIPCFHPASALHDTDNMPSVYWDYQRAGLFCRGELGLHEVEEATVKAIPTYYMPEDLDPTAYPDFALDTEDLVSGEPWCATVSIMPGEAFFIERDDQVALAKLARWFANPGLLAYIHNTMHDLKPVRKLGIQGVERGLWWNHHRELGVARVVDTMVLAFEQGRIHTQALKTLSYRLLGQLMKSYQDVVEPVRQRMAWGDLLERSAYDWGEPEATASWDEKTGKVKFSKPWSLNRRIDAILSSHSPNYKAYCDYRKEQLKELARKKPRPDKLYDWDYNACDPSDYEPNDQVDLVERWEGVDESALAPMRAMGYDTKIGQADLSHCDREEAIHYACTDASQTLKLGRELLTRHRVLDLLPISLIDHGQIPMVEAMQANGMPSNKQYFEDLGQEMRDMQAQVAEILEVLIGRPVNPNSSDQVAQLLYEEMKLPTVKLTGSGRASTGKKALQHLRDSNVLVEFIMMSREYAKVDDAFCGNIARRTETVEVFLSDGKVFPTFEERAFYELMVTRVKTGRLAAKNFNALAIPVRTKLGARIRKGFKCRPGRKLGTWDLNQIEMRVMAHESNDPLMVEIYNRSADKFPKHERDLHIITAAKVYGCKPVDVKKEWRTACKSTGFGIIMGITGKGLQDQMRLYGLDPEFWTEDECNKLIAQWLKVYQGVADYQMIRKAEARRYGQVRDMFGRVYKLPHATCPLSWMRGEAERQAHALPIQGAAQAMEKIAMANVMRELVPQLRELGHFEPVLQVHDELIFEFDADLAEVADTMMLDYLTTPPVPLRVPIEAGGAMAETWGDLEK